MTTKSWTTFPDNLAELPAAEPLGDLAQLYSPSELWAMRTRRSVLGHRDSGRLNMSPSTLASGAMGFVPGSGIADSLGLLPDLENGGFHPSLVANLLRGDAGAAGWQALGALGDALYFVPAAGPFLGAAAKAPRAMQIGKWAKYAERYPDVGPPALFDKMTNKRISFSSQEEADELVKQRKAYWGKHLTPEVEEFARDRRAIQRDMDENGYVPYFDPAKRARVEPEHYPTEVNTTVDAVPAREETMQRAREAYQTEAAKERLKAAYKKGEEIPEARNWHALKQVEDEYIKELGPEMGRQGFKEFADIMAATTAGNNATANWLMAQFVSHLNKRGLPLPTRSYDLPYPIGGAYGRGNLAQAQKQFDQPRLGFDEANPKRHDFAYSFLGHTDKPAVDSVLSNAIFPRMKAPRHYGPASELLKMLAADEAVTPGHFQDIARAGLQKLEYEAKHALEAANHPHPFRPDGPMIKNLNDSIERTHRLTGMPREEIVRRGLVLREVPMYGSGGVTLAPLAIYGSGSSTSDNSSSTRDGSL